MFGHLIYFRYAMAFRSVDYYSGYVSSESAAFDRCLTRPPSPLRERVAKVTVIDGSARVPLWQRTDDLAALTPAQRLAAE